MNTSLFRLSYVITLLLLPICTYSQKYRQVMNSTEIIDGEKYIIASSPNIESAFVMSYPIGENSPLFENMKEETALWTFKKSSTGYNIIMGTNKLVATDLELSFDTRGNITWTVENIEDGAFEIKNISSPTRYLSYGDKTFKNYSKLGMTDTLKRFVYIFCKSDDKKETPEETPIINTIDVRFGGSIHIATLYSKLSLKLPDGITAYKITNLSDSEVTLSLYESDDNTLPANTPFILKSSTSSTITLSEAIGSTALSYDAPQGVFGTTDNTENPASSSDFTDNIFVLGYPDNSSEEDMFGFYPYSGTTIPANKVYFKIPRKTSNTMTFTPITQTKELGTSSEVVLGYYKNGELYYSTTFSKNLLLSEKATSGIIPETALCLTFKAKANSSGIYSIVLPNNGNYLSYNKKGTDLTTATNVFYWNVKEAGDGTFIINNNSDTGRFLTYERTVDNHIKYYSSSSAVEKIHIYKKNETDSDTDNTTKRLLLRFDVVKGINSAMSKTENGNIYYDLNGRRVANPASGIFILNGKKIKL